MAHHKRRRAKNQRSGCIFCKPHKQNGWSPFRDPKRTDRQTWEAREKEREGRKEVNDAG